MSSRFPYLSERERGFDVCRRAASLADRTVQSQDGRRLKVFTAGDPGAPTVLVINPLGTSCLLTVKLIAALARWRRVVTWESRGLPDNFPDDPLGEHAWDPQSHTHDLAAVVATCVTGGIDGVVAYCSGSYLTLYATALGLVAASRIALISPPLEIRSGGRQTLYQQTIPALLARVAREGPKSAALVRAIMQNGVRATPEDGAYELHVLNNLPFGRDEYVYRYACLHAAWRSVPWTDLLPNIAVPTAIFHGSDDELVHADTVASLAAAILGSRLQVYERQGHFAVYTCDGLIRDAVSFVIEGGAMVQDGAARCP
jgi:pimeloyl-ACP methyl ester carboxylesterase